MQVFNILQNETQVWKIFWPSPDQRKDNSDQSCYQIVLLPMIASNSEIIEIVSAIETLREISQPDGKRRTFSAYHSQEETSYLDLVSWYTLLEL